MSNKNQKKPIASFDEVRLLIDELPGPDYDSQSAAVEREAKLKRYFEYWSGNLHEDMCIYYNWVNLQK